MANSPELLSSSCWVSPALGELQLVLFVIFLPLFDHLEWKHHHHLSHLLGSQPNTPMYLCVLSTSEIFYTIVILPKMLINLLSVFRTLSFVSCASQMYFFLGFVVTNCLLLGVMGYDRYAAICQPLHYPILMS